MPKKNAGYKKQWREERDEFEIIWFEKGQRRRKSTGTGDSKLADKILAEFIQKQERRTNSRLVEDVLADYLAEHAPHVAHPDNIAHAVKNLLLFFTGRAVDEITKALCQEYAAWRTKRALEKGETISNATIRRELAYLKAALNHDKEAERLEKVPTVWMPDAPPARDRWLTRDEAASLIRAARTQDARSNHLPWFILLSLYSGQRMRAVLNLTWDRVDLERGKVNWQYGRATNKRRPHQSIPDELWLFLSLLSKHGTKGYVLNRDGRKIDSVKKGFKSAVDVAAIRHATPHTLKHTSITWMLQNGTDLWSVSGFTGTSVLTIEKVYGHHADGHMEAARNSMKRGRARRFKVITAPETAPTQFSSKKNLPGEMRLSA